VPGADKPQPRPESVIRTLTTVGGLTFVGWLAFLLRQVALVRRVGPSQFDGVWEQRLEVLSFIVLPPNIVVLVPAAAAAATATWLAGPTQELGLAILLRLVRWSATVLAVIGVLSIVKTLLSDFDSPSRLEDIALRAGGILIATAIIVLCRDAGRTAPGG
jgi:hypothetical protein